MGPGAQRSDQPVMVKLVALFAVLALLTGVSAPPGVNPDGRSVLEVAPTLKSGEFVWAPEQARAGPAVLVVNLATQRAILFRNGIPIAASTLSSGRPGYETPTGVFTILQKHVEHYSRTYDNAPMPYMQRLTWKGVALHAGHLPGYPASHGCIRLPKEFARLLYGVTQLGMTVIITRLPVVPQPATAPVAAANGPDGEIARAPFDWNPDRSPHGLATVVVSVADQRAIIVRNGVVIGSAPVRIRGEVNGGWAYVLHRVDAAGAHWLKLHFDGRAGAGMEVSPDEANRFEAPYAFRQAVIALLRPGSIVVITPEPLAAGKAGVPVTVIEDAPPPSG